MYYTFLLICAFIAAVYSRSSLGRLTENNDYKFRPIDGEYNKTKNIFQRLRKTIDNLATYNCQNRNPCTKENIENGHFYFANDDPHKFVQCSQWNCQIRSCAFGTKWSVAYTTCTSKRDPLPVNCGVPVITPFTSTKIIGGIEAKPHSFPWQVSIQAKVKDINYPLCAGTILTSKTVLSVASCFFVAGVHSLNDSFTERSQTIKVKDYIIHPYYNNAHNNYHNDISIVTLEEPFTINDRVSPACLPSNPVSEGSQCIVSGWGESAEDTTAENLRQVTVPIINQTTCMSWLPFIIDTMVCAGYKEGGKDACRGDSGGPLVCKRKGKWYVDGVVSQGYSCAWPYSPGVYTRVYDFREFIISMLLLIN